MIFLLKNQVSSSVTLITWLPRNHYLSLDFFSSVLAFFLAFSLSSLALPKTCLNDNRGAFLALISCCFLAFFANC